MTASSVAARIRLVSINDVYTLNNYPRLSTMLSQLNPSPQAVTLCGDFLSPSPLSSVDSGKGNVATIRASGVTHACLGNHEADLKKSVLHHRFQKLTKKVTLINSNVRNLGSQDPEVQWWNNLMPEYSIIQSDCRRVSVALIGMLTDERGVFRNGTFRGIQITNVMETYQGLHKSLLEARHVDMLLPLTHMSIERDRELAHYMLELAPTCKNLILGGHDHDVIAETVLGHDDAAVSIYKSGMDAKSARLVDLEFDCSTTPAKLINVEQSLISLGHYEPAPTVQTVVDSHLSALTNIKEQVILQASRLIPPGKVLSSERSRQEQTTMGAVFCQSIKEELDVHVCLMNGAVIKGATTYPDAKLTYAQLQEELPFPTKMATVEMTRIQLQGAIRYSRMYNEEGNATDGDKRGFLQTDLDYDLNPRQDAPDDEVLQVALPRNLLAGFCKIVPLMELQNELEMKGKLPHSDDFTPAIDLVIRHACRQRWFDLIYDDITFDDIDINHDGYLDKSEIKSFMERYLKKDVPDFVVDDMMNSIDEDHNGLIDVGEFSYLLAKMEREHQWRKF
jgi:2',3'-cyclic-nucleotide 2'-phosphodiesterase (5'-nucleotidase family)